MDIIKLEKREDGVYMTFQDKKRLEEQDLEQAREKYEKLIQERDVLEEEIAPLEDRLDRVNDELEIFTDVFVEEESSEE